MDFRTVSSYQLLFMLGKLDSFLAGLGRNRVYSAVHVALPKQLINQFSKADNCPDILCFFTEFITGFIRKALIESEVKAFEMVTKK